MFNSTTKRHIDTKPTSEGTSASVHPKSAYRYPYRLNFYDKPPIEDITLDEFELYAIDRLHVLAEIESCHIRNSNPEQLRKKIEEQCKTYLPMRSGMGGAETDLERRKDHIGHFVLRLAFCQSEDLKHRFVRAESELFKYRYGTDITTERDPFLSSQNFGWTMVEINNLDHDKALKEDFRVLDPKATSWFKVKWTQVPNLVAKRRVILRSGWAYVPGKEQSSIVFQEFERRLENALEETARAIPRLDEDTRLMPILKHLGEGFHSGMSVASEYTVAENGEAVTANMIDDLASKHWPMCMRSLHDNLRKDRHLKHFGRQQYGLFLKVIGLSIDEAILFWRKAFQGRINDDKFNKEYKYNIRHSFGLEGKRTNYPAYNCQRIITQNQPGPQDCHGCPFRHYSHDRLQVALLAAYGSQGLKQTDMPEIMNAVKHDHYHVACTKVFEVTHGLESGRGLDGESVTHPNQYATKSREMDQGKGDVKTEDAMDVS